MLNIVLIEPERPQNTGNIARTASATGSKLHLAGPLGFELDDAKLKRAGLDYWHTLDIVYYKSADGFFEKNSGEFYYCSTKGSNVYSDMTYELDAYLVFGKETKGLPEELLEKNYSRTVRIPMLDSARSLNLSNSVAIIVYEALRQRSFEGLLKEGRLNNR